LLGDLSWGAPTQIGRIHKSVEKAFRKRLHRATLKPTEIPANPKKLGPVGIATGWSPSLRLFLRFKGPI
jgi:hypothetical protein